MSQKKVPISSRHLTCSGPVLVTGATGSIGTALCAALAEQGHDLIIHYHRNQAAAEKLLQLAKDRGVQATLLAGDFSSSEGVAHFLKECPPPSALIYTVGPHLTAPLLQTSLEARQQLMQTNFFAVWQLAEAHLPALEQQQGAILLFGVAGLHPLRCDRRAAAYRTAKLALWGWMRSFAREIAPRGVRINMISPGQVETSLELEQERPHLPMQRPASTQEIADIAVALLSEKFSYVTGQNIEVSGGYAL